MTTQINYHEYLASGEWALKKRAVRERCGGTCERCRKAPQTETHHLTYERLGNENLEDLLGLCGPCHDFLSGESDTDPAVVARNPFAGPVPENDWKLIEDFREKADQLPFDADIVSHFSGLIIEAIHLNQSPPTQIRLCRILSDVNKRFDERRRKLR